MKIQIHLIGSRPENFTFVESVEELQKFCDFAGSEFSVGMWIGSDFMTVGEFKSLNNINELFA